jgi:hypothetical protein
MRFYNDPALDAEEAEEYHDWVIARGCRVKRAALEEPVIQEEY